MNKKFEITVKKVDGKVNLSIKIPKELEKLFKELSNSAHVTSTNWLLSNNGGAKFYKDTPEYSPVNTALSRSNYSGNGYFNDFGASLYVNLKCNIAPLRTVGASDGITIISSKFESMTGVDIEYYVRQLAEAAKTIWEAFISNNEVKAIITFEL